MRKIHNICARPDYMNFPENVKGDLNTFYRQLDKDIHYGQLVECLTAMQSKYENSPGMIHELGSVLRHRIRLCIYHCKRAFRQHMKTSLDRKIVARGEAPMTDPDFSKNTPPSKIGSYVQLERRLHDIIYARTWKIMTELWNALRKDMMTQGFESECEYLQNEWFIPRWIFTFPICGKDFYCWPIFDRAINCTVLYSPFLQLICQRT